jgi:hypothetical protein
MTSWSFADRAWHAYHCLPRTRRGKPPSYNSLEKNARLSSGTLSRVMLGEREEFAKSTLEALARALQVSLDWLVEGKGEAPKPSGPVPPRLPYLNESNQTSGDVRLSSHPLTQAEIAKAFIDDAEASAPDALCPELLARAMMLATSRKT